jgi:putative pyrroloquinoline-quinone-binding quinoprotein
MTRIVLATVGIVYFVTTTFAVEPSRDRPRWRGPNADGVADNRKLPTQWSQSENIRWSVKLPGWGTSSPVVYGSQVFVTSELNPDGKKSLLTLCFDRTEGHEQSRRTHHGVTGDLRQRIDLPDGLGSVWHRDIAWAVKRSLRLPLETWSLDDDPVDLSSC